MFATALLFSQCLQNDFVAPLARFEALPNRLHVGYSESLRLMGELPEEGPVSRVMSWAYQTPDELLRVFHLRDWHDPGDPEQKGHLERFGPHCLQGTRGAEFAFARPSQPKAGVSVIDSLSLNDFHHTDLAQQLLPFDGRPRRVGIMGVWTEAKVYYLAYELRTRYPLFEVAVCSALTASSSRHHHFQALDQMRRLLGLRVIDSVGEFVDFLGGKEWDAPLLGASQTNPSLTGVQLEPTDDTLVRYLFRDCQRVELKVLDGGFSGNVVLGAEGLDLHGHEQVPHVVKVGPQSLMGQERASFERVQQVLGNNAPQISDFADFNDRGAIKYRYASMGGAFSTTFQKLYQQGLGLTECQRILDTVFGEQLGRLYKAASREDCDLLEHYGFSARWAPGVRRKVEALVGQAGPTLEPCPERPVYNLCHFYENVLAELPQSPQGQCYQAFVHGDLNGANIIVDGNQNVWMIDFFHTRRAHVLMDLIKLENDLLYIFTPLADEAELAQACDLSDHLLEVADLGAPLPECKFALDGLERAWQVVAMLRSHYPRLIHSDRDPYQYWVAALRYAAHTLGFDESSQLQRQWALYTASRLAEQVAQRLAASSRLRVDWLPDGLVGPGRLGLTLLPGRRDRGRQLAEDLESLSEQGVGAVVCLIPLAELESYGVGQLLAEYRSRGWQAYHLPIVDQRVTTVDEMRAAVDWVDERLAQGLAVVVHCVAGLGRSGMLAASLLTSRGLSPEEAIAAVRQTRSPRAVETRIQEQLVADFALRAR
ncbi:MAG: dual specificity protein phosphatase family protein [Vulcanimicrobiota bacterium]